MGGAKSGRKSGVDEDKRARVINYAWAMAENMVRDGKEYKPQRANLVQTIVSKTIPTVIEGNPERPLCVVEFARGINGTDTSSS